MERDTFVSHTSINLIFFSLGTGCTWGRSVVGILYLCKFGKINPVEILVPTFHLFIKIVVIYLFSSIFLNLPYVPASIMVLISQSALASLGSSLFASIT